MGRPEVVCAGANESNALQSRFHHRKIRCDKAIVSNARLAPRAPDSLECNSISRESTPRSEEDDQTRPVAIDTAVEDHKAG
jgi:hypothetical protein